MQNKVSEYKKYQCQYEDNNADFVNDMHHSQIEVGFLLIFVFAKEVGYYIVKIEEFPDWIFLSLISHDFSRDN